MSENIILPGNTVEWIDLETWERRFSFKNYFATDFPYIVITAEVDVTKPLAFAKKMGISFNLVMVYLCCKVIDSIPNYRYRFTSDGRPFIVGHTRPVVNHLKSGTEIFVIGEGPWPCDDIVEFCKVTHENQENARPEDCFTSLHTLADEVNFTSIPWIQYTGFVRTIIKDGYDNAPKISFGKYHEAGGRILMPVSNQSHHGLMDGQHVGQFYSKLQEACDSLSFD